MGETASSQSVVHREWEEVEFSGKRESDPHQNQNFLCSQSYLLTQGNFIIHLKPPSRVQEIHINGAP